MGCKLTWRSRSCTHVKAQRAEAEGLPSRRKSETPTPRLSRIRIGAQLSPPLTRRTNPTMHSCCCQEGKAKAAPISEPALGNPPVVLSPTLSLAQSQRYLHPYSSPFPGPLGLNGIGLYGDLKPQFPLVSSI